MAARSREKRLCAGAGGPGKIRGYQSPSPRRREERWEFGFIVGREQRQAEDEGEIKSWIQVRWLEKQKRGRPRKCEASALKERFLFLSNFCLCV